jgi:hypothetical protein
MRSSRESGVESQELVAGLKWESEGGLQIAWANKPSMISIA